ncbi:MAG TPA: hypothetical protein VH143_23560 [Kofleriaceae bacterium]|jgi:hypothetical protein|nr:hypothetical protein [Kofleriaceae bacterium]
MRAFALVAVIVFACSDSGTQSIDAPARSPDSGSPPLDVNAVTVTITSHGAGLAGVKAYFTTADNATTTMRETDATGMTGYDLGSGGYVTVVDAFGKGSDGHHSLQTWAGVMPRDQLVLDDPAGANTNFSYEIDTVASGYEYDATTLCSDGVPGNGQLFVTTGSASAQGASTTACSTPDVYISVEDMGSNLLAGLWVPAANVGSGSIDLTADPFVKFVPATYSYTNLPANSQTRFDVEQVNATGTIFTGGLPTPTLGPGTASANVPQAPLFPNMTSLVDTVIITPSDQHDIQTWSQTATTSYSLDVSNVLLPEIMATPTFDYGSGVLAWTAGSGAVPDAVFAQLVFVNDPMVDSWELVAPYGSNALQFPTIPGIAPASTDTLQTLVQLMKVFDGYDSFRARYYVGSTARRVGSGEAVFVVRKN